ncbi:Muc4 [Lemmus lemmus]
MTSATSTDMTSSNTGHTTTEDTQSSNPVTTQTSRTTNKLSTKTASKTTAQESPSLSPTYEARNTGTSSEPQTSTLTDVTSKSEFTLTATVTRGTSSSGDSTTSSMSRVGSSPLITSQVSITKTSTDSTSGNIGRTASTASQNSTPGITDASKTMSSKVLLTVTTPITSTQELTTSSQNLHIGSINTSSTPQTTLTEVTTSSFLPFTSGSPPVQTASQGTSSPEYTTNLYTSSIINPNQTTSDVSIEISSTESSTGYTGITSPTVSQSSTPVNSDVSMTNSPNVLSTVTIPISATQEFPTSSQNLHTGSMDPSSTPKTTLTEVTTSHFSTSPSGSTPAQTVSHGTSSSEETTNLSTSSVTNTKPTTSEVSTGTFSTDFTSGNTESTSPTFSQSSVSVNTDGLNTISPNVVSTVTSPITATGELSTSQNDLPGSTETSSIAQTTLTEVITSSLSTSHSGSTAAQTVSHGISPPEETTIPSSSTVISTIPTTSEVPSMAPSTESAPGNTGHTTSGVTPSLPSATTQFSVTSLKQELSTVSTPITSTQELTKSQNLHTESMDTSSTPQITLTEVTTSNFLPFTSGLPPAQTASQGTSSPEDTTNLYTSTIINPNQTTSEVSKEISSTESSTGNTGVTTPTVSESSTPDITAGSMTSSPNFLSKVTSPITATQALSTSLNLHTGSMDPISTPQTTLTEVATSHFSTSTVSHGTSSPEETSNLSTSSATNNKPITSEVSTGTFSTDSTSGNTETTSPTFSQSSVSVNTDGLNTISPNVVSTVTSPITATGELSTSQNDLPGSTETSSIAQTTLTEVITSSLSTSHSGSTAAQTVSHGISPPEETTIPSSSTVISTIPTTSEVPSTAPSTESAPGSTAPDIIQSSSETATKASVTSSPLSTLSVPITSSQEVSTSSHRDHIESTVTSSPSQNPLTPTHSSSPWGPTVTQAESQRTATPGETTSMYAHTMSTSPPSFPSTDTPSVDTGHTTAGVIPSLPSATTQFSVTSLKQELSTVSTPITSTQELTKSQNLHTESMDASSTPQTTLTEVTTSNFLPFTSGLPPAQTASQGTSSPEDTTNLYTSTIINPNQTTSEVSKEISSTESSTGNTGVTTPTVSESSTPDITAGSMTSSPNFLSKVTSPITATQALSTSLNLHTGSMDPISTPQTTLTEVTTSRFSTSPRGSTLAQTVSHGTSSPEETTNLSTSSATNSKPTTSEVSPATFSTDSMSVDTGHPTAGVTPSTPSATTQFSVTSLPQELSTVSTPITSTQELTTSSQTFHTESMDTSSTPQTTLTEVTTSSFLPSTRGSPPVQTASQGTSSPEDTTNLFTSSIINPNQTTSDVSKISSTESTRGNTGITTPTVSESSTSDITAGSMTSSPNFLSKVTSPITATPALSTSSQNLHTGSMDTSSTPQTTLTEVTTSTFLHFTSGSAPAQTASQGSSSPEETTNLSTSSVTNTKPTTSEVSPSTFSTDSTSGNTESTSPTFPQTSIPVNTDGLMTNSPNFVPRVTSPIITTGELSTSQNDIPGSTETSSTAQTALTEVTTSSFPPFTSGSAPAQTVSQWTSSPEDTTNLSIPNVTNTKPTISEVPTASLSTDSTSENAGITSPTVSQGSIPVNTNVTMTKSPSVLSTVTIPVTATQESSTSSQNLHTEALDPSSTPQTTLPEVTTSRFSTSPSGSTPDQTVSHGPSSPNDTTNLPTSSVIHTNPTTSVMPTASVSTDSSSGNTGTKSPTVSQISSSVMTDISMTSSANVLSMVTTPITYTQEYSPSSQSVHTGSMEISSTPHTTLPEVMPSTRSFSPSVPTPTQTISWETSSSSKITTPSASSRSNPSRATPDISASPASTSGNTGPASAQVTGSLSIATSRVPSTTLAGQPTVLAHSTSTQLSSTYSQSYQTTSMTSSSTSQTSILTELTTENHSSSSPGPTATHTPSHGTSSSGESAETDSGRGTSLSATSLTLTTPSTTTISRSTVSPIPILPEPGISLFPYGTSPEVGDHRLFARTVDFTSPLFKIQIGFPLGSSLRDSFYFTDNGQIIFPESDYSIFSYPNPPQRGFTGRDSVAMVAPFWDDADFSSSRGSIFYQEYNTLYDENNGLIRKVETLIREFTSDWSYKAKWTLKVTWFNVPAYPAQRNYGTNTYQAILSTDGSSSYALFLYHSGGMSWDVTQGLSNRAVMGFSSGDGYFGNSPLTFRPAMEKYRPDRFLNSKLGIRGLQVYRLHKEVRPNYRLKCLWWLDSQPQWTGWSRGWSQLSCPCSWQQGRWDLRFWRMNTGWWYGSDRQLCSFSSGRGGVCCSYGRWGEFREGWRMHSPWQFEQEREAQKWCCHWNDKPSFCALYHRARPRLSCAMYRPPRPAWTYGDPHITTLDNVTYTFNGLGDFLLVQAQDANSSFLLEGRTAQTGSAKATNFIAFAAQYNTSSLTSPITVQWFLEPNDTIRVLHNHQTVTFNTSYMDEDLPVFNTTGVLLTQNGSQVSANFDGTVTISVIALSNLLHASSSLPEEYRNHTQGLLGVWNDNPEDDFRMPNGSTIPANSSEETVFHYGMTWQVNGTGLLGVRTDSLPSNFTPVFLSQLLNVSNEHVTSGCHGDPQCKFDALATGNTTIGQNTNRIFKTFQHVNGTLNKYPPSINCPSEIQAYKGKTEIIEITSDSKDVTFNLTNECSGFKLSDNGSLLWTPALSQACTLEILATDVRTHLSSLFQPKTVACFCNMKSQCLYNETRREGNSSLEVTSCKCDEDSFGRFCEHSKNLCEIPCFPKVPCIPGKGCGSCPPNMTGDGRHCAALEDSLVCQNHFCPTNYCYNHGHCSISGAPGCQPTCTCPPAFTDTRCFLAGNDFTPTVSKELPLRTIMLSLRENENASQADVNASVAYRLGTLDVRAFLSNSQVELVRMSPSAQPSDKSIQHWQVVSHFQYRPRGPVIHFLNHQLIDAVVEAFLLQARSGRPKRSNGEARRDVTFFPISRADIHDVTALNLSMLDYYFLCDGYKGYKLVYSPQNGVTCVSPCSEGYCHNGGQCQHLPNGPQCSCASFTIYTSWGEHCEHLSVKLGAFFGILFGALGALLLLGILAFAAFHFCGSSMYKFSYPLASEL